MLVGGLFGILGSMFVRINLQPKKYALLDINNHTLQAQRKSARFFSIIVWICCGLSFSKYVISLVLMIVYRQNMINTCIRSGFVGLGNPQAGLVPTTISTNSYYSPVKYPDTMNQFASSAEDCESAVKMTLILWGALIFVIQLIQVKLHLPDNHKLQSNVSFC